MEALLIWFMWLLPVLAGASALYLGLRFVRATERRSVGGGELRELRERVDRLEEDLGRSTADVERLEEAQRFMQRLLGDAASEGRRPPDVASRPTTGAP